MNITRTIRITVATVALAVTSSACQPTGIPVIDEAASFAAAASDERPAEPTDQRGGSGGVPSPTGPCAEVGLSPLWYYNATTLQWTDAGVVVAWSLTEQSRVVAFENCLRP